MFSFGKRITLASEAASISIRDSGSVPGMKGKKERRTRRVMAVRTHTEKRSKDHLGRREQLLPGLPNEITLDLIAPKLPWKAFRVLSSVSRCWQEAIQSNDVYEARVRANSTDTLIVHFHLHDESADVLALYSTSEKCCYELPPTPCLPRGVVDSCECIGLDGKLYVLAGRRLVGGEKVLGDGRVVRDIASIRGFGLRDEVYVLDLAGQTEWKQCASMPEAKHAFSCGVMEEKIYIFGGCTKEKCPLGSQVYDTQGDAWSPIMPMTRGTVRHRVGTVGKELVVYLDDISTLRVYNPAEDEWRSVEHFCEEKRRSPLFIAKEKFYSVSHSGIDVYDIEQRSWINRYANSFATIQPDDVAKVMPSNVLAVKDELLLTAWCPSPTGLTPLSFQCKGFDTKKKEMLWQRTGCSGSTVYTPGSFNFLCSIQL